MKVDRSTDPAAFLDAAGPLLLEDEARHNLILGIAGTLRDYPDVYREFGLWLVRDGDEAVGAALRTPPFNLVLARPRDDAALEALAGAIDEELPGVVGAVPEVDRFAELWSARTGTEARVHIAEGVFALEGVEPVTSASGGMRDATEEDRPLLVEWYVAFEAEAFGDESDRTRVEGMVDHRLRAVDSGLVVWDDGNAVSLAGFGGKTPNGIRIGPVYTPPELRGRGYATALVAELSQRLLDSGRTFCFLYTDLANPTSNRIYERIGYRRVCDAAEIRFLNPGDEVNEERDGAREEYESEDPDAERIARKRLDSNDEVGVLVLSGDPQARSVLDSLGDANLDPSLAQDLSAAAALRTGNPKASLAFTSGTRLDLEPPTDPEPGRDTDGPFPGTAAADLDLRAGSGARSVAGCAQILVGDLDLAPGAAGSLEGVELDEAEDARRARAAVRDTRAPAAIAEVVVEEARARLGKDVVRRRHLAELFMSPWGSRDIGVQVARQAAERQTDLVRVGRLRQTEHLVVVALRVPQPR